MRRVFNSVSRSGLNRSEEGPSRKEAYQIVTSEKKKKKTQQRWIQYGKGRCGCASLLGPGGGLAICRRPTPLEKKGCWVLREGKDMRKREAQTRHDIQPFSKPGKDLANDQTKEGRGETATRRGLGKLVTATANLMQETSENLNDFPGQFEKGRKRERLGVFSQRRVDRHHGVLGGGHRREGGQEDVFSEI